MKLQILADERGFNPLASSASFWLGRVDKLNPDADGGKQHECGEALGQFVVAGGDPT